MTRRNVEPEIPPFINRFGQPTYDNHCGQNRPNPALAQPVAIAPHHSTPNVVLAQKVAEKLSARRVRVRRRVQGGVAAFVAIFSAFVGVTAASAYFTAAGAGHGQAHVGTLSVTVSATTGTPSTPLIPGGTGDVALQVVNPNSFAVTLKAVTGSGTITPDAGHATCAPTGVSFTDQSALSINVPANSTTPVALTGAASMSTLSANGCQGATFTIPVTIGVRKP
jgi:hypothetical protein